jgi:hypothetical protein
MGESVYRKGWNGHHKLTVQNPDAHSKMTQSYIYMTTEQGERVPWCPSQTDILSSDWAVINQE